MLLNITSTGDGLLRIVNTGSLDWPWNLKIRGFSDFFLDFWLLKSELRRKLPANRNCYRLSRVSWALAQISCSVTANEVTNNAKWFSYTFFQCMQKKLKLYLYLIIYESLQGAPSKRFLSRKILLPPELQQQILYFPKELYTW